ncbi:hypothetical protein O181_007016 [Austropuccinia psidii MF-1]|uniref:Uncharacterized protein n=1 Tax=Austropuccinia psidii MF-1 TaxID=1389203 RepID=A0A9Q3BLZ9_9BASI|nr:hypothetical protein [Austropuccinia psidii MF-1]
MHLFRTFPNQCLLLWAVSVSDANPGFKRKLLGSHISELAPSTESQIRSGDGYNDAKLSRPSGFPVKSTYNAEQRLSSLESPPGLEPSPLGVLDKFIKYSHHSSSTGGGDNIFNSKQLPQPPANSLSKVDGGTSLANNVLKPTLPPVKAERQAASQLGKEKEVPFTSTLFNVENIWISDLKKLPSSADPPRLRDLEQQQVLYSFSTKPLAHPSSSTLSVDWFQNVHGNHMKQCPQQHNFYAHQPEEKLRGKFRCPTLTCLTIYLFQRTDLLNCLSLFKKNMSVHLGPSNSAQGKKHIQLLTQNHGPLFSSAYSSGPLGVLQEISEEGITRNLGYNPRWPLKQLNEIPVPIWPGATAEAISDNITRLRPFKFLKMHLQDSRRFLFEKAVNNFVDSFKGACRYPEDMNRKERVSGSFIKELSLWYKTYESVESGDEKYGYITILPQKYAKCWYPPAKARISHLIEKTFFFHSISYSTTGRSVTEEDRNALINWFKEKCFPKNSQSVPVVGNVKDPSKLIELSSFDTAQKLIIHTMGSRLSDVVDTAAMSLVRLWYQQNRQKEWLSVFGKNNEVFWKSLASGAVEHQAVGNKIVYWIDA